MSHTFSQPEEIDRILLEIAATNSKQSAPVHSAKSVGEDTQKILGGGYVSPYRAIKMKSLLGLSSI